MLSEMYIVAFDLLKICFISFLTFPGLLKDLWKKSFKKVRNVYENKSTIEF